MVAALVLRLNNYAVKSHVKVKGRYYPFKPLYLKSHVLI